jgi:hypothetical protein
MDIKHSDPKLSVEETWLTMKIGKNMMFWRKIVIFHTKYPKNVRASLRSAHFY